MYVKESLVYLMKYHQAQYDEQTLSMRPNARLPFFFKQSRQAEEELIQTFLFITTAMLSTATRNATINVSGTKCRI
jgi:hypothetical protein